MDEKDLDAVFDGEFDGTPTDETPADDAATAGTPTAATPADAETAPPATPAAQGDEQSATDGNTKSYTFRRMGQEVTFTPDDLKPIAEKLGMAEHDIIANLQKGAEYDHKVELLNERTKTHNAIEQIAKAQGRSVDEVISVMTAAMEKAERARIETDVRNQHPGADESTVNELADLRAQQERALAQQRREQEQVKQQAAITGMWRDFFSKYPDVQPKDIPDEVKTSFLRGVSPSEAYLAYRVQQQAAELAEKARLLQEKEQDMANRSKSVGSVAGNAGGGDDDIFASFESVFK